MALLLHGSLPSSWLMLRPFNEHRGFGVNRLGSYLVNEPVRLMVFGYIASQKEAAYGLPLLHAHLGLTILLGREYDLVNFYERNTWNQTWR